MSETIVVGYDGKEPSERALERAIETVKEAGGNIVLVVVDYMPVDPGVVSGYNLDLAALRPPVPLATGDPPPPLKAVIDEGMKRIEAGGVAGDFVWGVGDPARTIVDTAQDVGATKVMIGSDHHGFLGRLLGEDVQAEVEREAGCEVVVVE
jgi:nucleotide-binding universal stress UspA family protein